MQPCGNVLRIRATLAFLTSFVSVLALVRVRGMIDEFGTRAKVPPFIRDAIQFLNPALVFLFVDLPAVATVVHGICSAAVVVLLEDGKVCRRLAQILERLLATWHFWTSLSLLFAEYQEPGMCLLTISCLTGLVCMQPWNSGSGCWAQAEEVAPKPARDLWPSQEFSEQLRRYGSACTICLEDYQEGDEVSRLPCGHLFHSNCINSWYQVRGTCPLRCSLDSSGMLQDDGQDVNDLEDDGQDVNDLEASRGSALQEGHSEAVSDLEVRSLGRDSRGEDQSLHTVSSESDDVSVSSLPLWWDIEGNEIQSI